MIIWSIVFFLYALVTVFAIYMSYQEQKRQERPSLMFNLIGYLACTTWPLVAALIFIAARRRPVRLQEAELD
jgi:hypothetical protein